MVELIITAKKEEKVNNFNFHSACSNYEKCLKKYGDSAIDECQRGKDDRLCYHDAKFTRGILETGKPLPICHNNIRFISSDVPETDIHWDYKNEQTVLSPRKLKIEKYVFPGTPLEE